MSAVNNGTQRWFIYSDGYFIFEGSSPVQNEKSTTIHFPFKVSNVFIIDGFVTPSGRDCDTSDLYNVTSTSFDLYNKTGVGLQYYCVRGYTDIPTEADWTGKLQDKHYYRLIKY